MEGSNYWGYGYKTQHFYPRSRLITWRRPEVKIGRNVVRRNNNNNKKTTKMRTKKSAIKTINSQIKSLISKGFPIKTVNSLSLFFPWIFLYAILLSLSGGRAGLWLRRIWDRAQVTLILSLLDLYSREFYDCLYPSNQGLNSTTTGLTQG